MCLNTEETEDNDDYFVLETMTWIFDECPHPAEMLTFKLSCPSVFDNDIVHEIVTYWKESKKATGIRLCYRIELDGKECTEEITHEQHNQISRITIILDR